MSVQDGAASIWAQAVRLGALDATGLVDPGASVYVTDKMVKLTMTPVVTTGDDIEIKNAAGNLVAFGKHGDIPRYGTLSIEFGVPDPGLEQLLAGGTLLNSTAMALGAPTGLTVTPQATLGTLAALTYGYRASQYNVFGETPAEATVTATTSGSTGANVISGVTLAASAIGALIYGRIQGSEQLLGTIPNIGSQATAAASGTGTVTSLTVTALTQSIPAGTKFQIAGDTNTTKIVFTTTAFAPAGAVTLAVSVSQSVTTTIAAGAINPVFVDDGSVTPSGGMQVSDQTAGPGVATGYQAPTLGVVANPNGVGIEVWEYAIVNGRQASKWPYWWWVFPLACNFRVMPRDLANTNTQTILEGQCFENPAWGSGPSTQWPFDSSKYYQRTRCGSKVVPQVSATVGAAI